MATKSFTNLDKPVQVVTVVADNGDNTASNASAGPQVDVNNSTSANLAGGAAFTGTGTDVSRYASINISVYSSHVSATDGLSLQWSVDNVNWRVDSTYTIPATSYKTFSVQVSSKYFRLVYTNGATLTTTLEISSMLKVGTNPTSSVRPQDGRTNDNDMQEGISYNAIWDPVGLVWNRMRASPYQINQTPLIAKSGNVANASAAATLTGTASTTVYITGFEVTGSGATAGLPVTVTVAGLLGGTIQYTYDFAVGALVGNTPLIVAFNPPLPASAINTAIVVTCPASGTGGTNNTTVAHGFYQ